MPGHAVYTGSKAAVEAMVRCLALDLAPLSWPMGRFGELCDLTPVVRFLCSPESGWITGHTLRVAGGQ